jgi:hypothetical protein
MAFRLEGRGDNYVKLAWGGVEVGWEWHVFQHYQAGTIAAKVSYLVFILILVIVDPSPAKSPAEGEAMDIIT